MLETINYNKVDPVIQWVNNGLNYKIYLFFYKNSLEIQKVMFGVYILLNTSSQ